MEGESLTLSKRFFWKINSRFGRSILKILWRTHVRPDLHRIGHLDSRVKNVCFPAWSKETLFLEGRWECLKMVGTASSFSMFPGFVPINSACKSRLKQDGSTDSVSGMNFLFRLCKHFFLISSFFDESRWKLIFLFLLFAELYWYPGAPQLVIFNFFFLVFMV